ncbi:hypothetical protein, partial [Bradyrhizobium japonicum]|uniref:hypothetical protein n=1 Tax=Bradyrhizobium japonicum TaxID=375 RepID=UPI001AEBAD79
MTAWPCKLPTVLTLQQAAIDAFMFEEVERRACRSDDDQEALGLSVEQGSPEDRARASALL